METAVEVTVEAAVKVVMEVVMEVAVEVAVEVAAKVLSRWPPRWQPRRLWPLTILHGRSFYVVAGRWPLATTRFCGRWRLPIARLPLSVCYCLLAAGRQS